MSGTQTDDDDRPKTNGHINGSSVSDDDVWAMLDQERANTRKLKAELTTERSERSRAQQAVTTQTTARFAAEEQALTAALTASEARATGLKKEYSEALAEGRFDEAAEIQDKLAALRAAHQQYLQHKQWLDGEKTRASQAPPPRDEGVNLAQYSAAQRRWIRENPEFMDDERVRKKTFAGHQLAVANDVEVDSPEYFEIIDSVVHGTKRPPSAEDSGHEAPVPRRREAPPEMPVTRTPPRQAERQKAYKLTEDEKEAADITLPSEPIDGHTDGNGRWVPGRYEKYAIQRQKHKARGGG